jgi:hypothetical protein
MDGWIHNLYVPTCTFPNLYFLNLYSAPTSRSPSRCWARAPPRPPAPRRRRRSPSVPGPAASPASPAARGTLRVVAVQVAFAKESKVYIRSRFFTHDGSRGRLKAWNRAVSSYGSTGWIRRVPPPTVVAVVARALLVRERLLRRHQHPIGMQRLLRDRGGGELLAPAEPGAEHGVCALCGCCGWEVEEAAAFLVMGAERSRAHDRRSSRLRPRSSGKMMLFKTEKKEEKEKEKEKEEAFLRRTRKSGRPKGVRV